MLFPPLECRKLRLVCTRNAAAAMMSAEHVPRSLLGRGGPQSRGLIGTSPLDIDGSSTL